ncbi:hypothetical protein QT979_05915 [Microcoleus sp. w2-18bC1]|uniref:hypothetical protein n=1 Tax=unclassified Microcoleus TaxID=2642155 RepID=UPI002FCEC846
MLDQQNPREYDAVLGGQVLVPEGAAVLGGLPGVRRRLASPHLASQIGAMSEACKYGEPGFDLMVQFLKDKSILSEGCANEPTVKSAGKICVSSMLNDTLVTDDLGWYLIGYRVLYNDSKIDTLRLACQKLLAYIHTLYGKKKWYFTGGYSYITFSQVQDREWAKGNRKNLSDSINHLVQILSAEKLRRVIILNFVYYCQTYYDIGVAYQKEVPRNKFPDNIEPRLLNQGIYHSLLPWFEEDLSRLISSSFEDLVIE